MIARYAKAVVAVLGVVAVAASKALADDAVSLSDLVEIGIALVTAVGVLAWPNRPALPGREVTTR